MDFLPNPDLPSALSSCVVCWGGSISTSGTKQIEQTDHWSSGGQKNDEQAVVHYGQPGPPWTPDTGLKAEQCRLKECFRRPRLQRAIKMCNSSSHRQIITFWTLLIDSVAHNAGFFFLYCCKELFCRSLTFFPHFPAATRQPSPCFSPRKEPIARSTKRYRNVALYWVRNFMHTSLKFTHEMHKILFCRPHENEKAATAAFLFLKTSVDLFGSEWLKRRHPGRSSAASSIPGCIACRSNAFSVILAASTGNATSVCRELPWRLLNIVREVLVCMSTTQHAMHFLWLCLRVWLPSSLYASVSHSRDVFTLSMIKIMSQAKNSVS